MKRQDILDWSICPVLALVLYHGLIGPVIDFFNAYSPNLGYQAMLLVCFICFVVGTLLIIKIKQPQPLR